MGGRIRLIGKTRVKFEDTDDPKAEAVVALCEALDTSMCTPPCLNNLDRLDAALLKVRDLFPKGTRAELSILLGLAESKTSALYKSLQAPQPSSGDGWAW